MPCYRDRTFCEFWINCKHGIECPQALTDDVKKQAAQYNLNISEFMCQPDCFEYFMNKDEDDD